MVDSDANGLTSTETQQALSDAMSQWGAVNCSDMQLVQLSDRGIDWGFYQYASGFGGSIPWHPDYPGQNVVYADIIHSGWLPADFFDFWFGPDVGVLGVTFTFIWVSYEGPTDIDGNEKYDTAFAEIYYNNAYEWGIGTDLPYDVETIVLHETGHALSLGHFGKIFRTDEGGKVHYAPKAVMNAMYSGVQELTGTDNSGFCTVWSNWSVEPVCIVDFSHFAKFALHWMDTDCDAKNNFCDGSDLDNLGDVNIDDLKIFSNEWLNYCPYNWPLK